MSFWSRLLGRGDAKAASAVEQRGSTQDYVDSVLSAQEFGVLQTSMSTLSEEQVGATYSSIAKSNGPVFALMLARMQLFSQARFQWTRFQRGERGDLFGSPELGVLERPWPGGTTSDLLARMELDVTAAGNSFTRRLSRGRLRGRQDRLVRLRPDWVKIILGSREDAEHPAEAADVELVGYAYLPMGDPKRMVPLAPDEVAHYAPYPDPDSTYLGMSWLTPVIRDVLGDNLQTDHKRQFLRNAATPNLVITFDPTTTVDAVKKFKELFESEHVGVRNAYRTLFIGGGADAKAVGANFRELDFAVTQGKAESRLASAAGVPPSWVGFSEGLQGSALNAGNFTAARRRLSDGTLQHLWANASTSLETIVDPPGGGAELWFSTKGMPFLHMDASDEADIQSKEAGTIRQLVDAGFTPDSITLAILNHDWSQLNHSNLYSVQLQPAMPDQPAEPSTNGTGPSPAPAGAGGSGV